MEPVNIANLTLAKGVERAYIDPNYTNETFTIWAIHATEHSQNLMKLRATSDSPSLWYLAWFKIWAHRAGIPDLNAIPFYNPFYIIKVANVETEAIVEQYRLDQTLKIIDYTQWDTSMVQMLILRKPFSHTELHRAQQLHISLVITRPMFMASQELKKNHSMTQIQRKWLPEPWVAHLATKLHKHFVRQIILIERFQNDFIQTNILFAKDLHLHANTLKRSKRHIICIVNHTDAVIFGPSGITAWKGTIDHVVPAWIAITEWRCTSAR